MSLVSYAEDELKRAGLLDTDSDYEGALGEAVMKMVRVFSDEGHSGMSAGMAISLFEKVARWEPLTPLTGEDDEWSEVYSTKENGTTYQSKRCPTVFKDDRGSYDIDGRVFREPDGSCYTNSESHVFISFPYTPTREYGEVAGR